MYVHILICVYIYIYIYIYIEREREREREILHVDVSMCSVEHHSLASDSIAYSVRLCMISSVVRLELLPCLTHTCVHNVHDIPTGVHGYV